MTKQTISGKLARTLEILVKSHNGGGMTGEEYQEVQGTIAALRDAEADETGVYEDAANRTDPDVGLGTTHPVDDGTTGIKQGDVAAIEDNG